MKKALRVAALTAMLVGCSQPINPTLLQDGQLVVAGLEALDTAVAQFPGVPAADTMLAGLVLTAVQDGLTALQAGTKAPADFASLVNTEITKLAPPLLADLHVNQTITTGVVLLQGLIPVIAAEVQAGQTAAPKATLGPDPRAALQTWVGSRK